MNSVNLIGNMTKDVEVHYSKSGVAVVKTSIAVNNRRDDTTMYINLVFFGKLGETVNQYLRRGDKIGVGGRLQLDQWVNNNGEKRQAHSIIVQDLEMLGKPKGTQTTENTATPEMPTAKTYSMDDFDDDEIPF